MLPCTPPGCSLWIFPIRISRPGTDGTPHSESELETETPWRDEQAVRQGLPAGGGLTYWHASPPGLHLEPTQQSMPGLPIWARTSSPARPLLGPHRKPAVLALKQARSQPISHA